MLYPAAAVERTMKVQEVLLRAMSGELRWLQAADILGWSPRTVRRWRRRYERWGYDGLWIAAASAPPPAGPPWPRWSGSCGCTGRRTGGSTSATSTSSPGGTMG